MSGPKVGEWWVCRREPRDKDEMPGFEGPMLRFLNEPGLVVSVGEQDDQEFVRLYFQSRKNCDWLFNAKWLEPVTTPAPKVATVPIRVAVAVDEKGNYQATGSKERGQGFTDESLRESALDFLFGAENEDPAPYHVVFVTADVPLPTKGQEVQGSVEVKP